MGRLAGATKGDVFFILPEDLVIITEKDHPLFDERALLEPDEKFIRNIAMKGVFQNVVVRRNGETVEVVAGRQRVKAAREANKRFIAEGKEPMRVPCVIKRGDDADLFGITLSENEHRRDDGMLTKAKKLQRFLAMGRTEDEAAVIFGVTTQSIKIWSKLLDLHPKVQTAVEKGSISASAAAQLHSLSRDEQVEKLAELESAGTKNTVEKVRAVASGKDPVKRPSRKTLIEAIESDQTPHDVRDVLKWVVGQRKSRPW